MEPILRFKADDGSDFSDWEKMTLGDVCVFVRNGYAYSSDGSRNHRYKLTRIESISGGVINDEKLGSSDEIDPRYRLVDGDILFSNINSLPYLGNVARYINDLGEIYHGMNLLCIRPRANEINSIFLFELLGTSRIRRYEITHAKAAVNQCSLPSSDVKAMSLYCPSLPEQRKIADLLSAVDDVITTQEAEVAAWEKRKKGVMQKLFSQEVRFKADDGSDFPDWEKMTLGDVGSVAMCKRVFKEQTREVGDVPFFKIGTFGGVPDAYISKSLFDELKSKYAYPEVGTILLSASGTIGRQVEYKGEDAYYQDSNIVWLKHDDTVLNSYLKQFYSVVKWQGLEGSTIKRLYNKTILDTPFYRPSLPEQRKIADCLALLDDVIAKAKDELDAWRELKKGLLQQMFV